MVELHHIFIFKENFGNLKPLYKYFLILMTSLKGAGRGGRKTLSGKRNRVLVYVLYNASDIAGNVPGLSSEVREFCTTKDCLKESFQNKLI